MRQNIKKLLARWFPSVFEEDLGGLRDYDSYDAYLAHQKDKTLDPVRREKWLGEEWQTKLDGFKDIFQRNQEYVSGKASALCLGARTGQEVQALIDLGVAAKGVDLVPQPPHVEAGDIHNLAFEDNAFDLLFTNIIDHSLYPDQFVAEMERVCRPGGHIIVQFVLGEDIDQYSATAIYNPKGVHDLFKSSEIVESRSITNTFDSMQWEVIAQGR